MQNTQTIGYSIHTPSCLPAHNAVNSRYSADFGNGHAHGVRMIPEGAFGQCEVRDQYDKNYLYQALYCRGIKVDSNDPATLGRHLQILRNVRGNVLVSNVGLGGFLYRLIRKPGVCHIIVAEPNDDILELVEPSFCAFADKVTFVNGTVGDVISHEHFDFVYLNEDHNQLLSPSTVFAQMHLPLFP